MSSRLMLALVTVGLQLTLVAAAGVASQPAQTGLQPTAARTIAPDFALPDARGDRVALSRYKGRVVLLDFWATWCTGCKVEIPWYIEFQKVYASQGLTSIGAAMDDEGWAKVKPYLAEHPIPYSIVIGNPDLVQPYDIKNLPVTLLIDRRGRIADAHAGVVDKEKWEQEIRQLLRER
ncbi:MAG TPA: redoxin domain-containing protein [Vicinamibacterales bacterium]|nr:redoxin domain-containing protein [Vicinamibacterales bacterium]